MEKPVDKLFPLEAALVKAKFCPFCMRDVSTIPFKDELSKREFRISGLCQNCQDDVFGGDNSKVAGPQR